MATITIKCDCGKSYDVRRTSEIPDWVIGLGCNFCPVCEDNASGYWEEWYLPENEGDAPPEPPVPDNQLTMPFIFDEIGIGKVKVLEPCG